MNNLAPKIIYKCLPLLRTMSNNDVEDIALINCLNSKFAQLVNLKGANFRQYNNSNPKTLSYYAINFMQSGATKDFNIDNINDYFMPFMEDEYKKNIENFKETYTSENLDIIANDKESKHKNLSDKEKEVDEFLDKIREPQLEIARGSIEGLYATAKNIDLIKFGSVYVRISELGDYISSENKMNKDFLNNLKDVYEGNIVASTIKSDPKAKNLKMIPVSAILYTDYYNMLDDKANKYFKSFLATGMARRCFIYMPTEKKPLNKPTHPKERENAITETVDIKDYIFEKIYKKIMPKQTYIMSEESKELLYKFSCDCVDEINDLCNAHTIEGKSEKESFWKVTKLAVIYSIIDNPTQTIVESKYVKYAINFYKQISKCLSVVLSTKELTPEQKLKEYLRNNIGKIITRSDIRDQRFKNSNSFKRWMDEEFLHIVDELKDENIYISECKNVVGNTKKYKIYQPGELIEIDSLD